MDTKKNNVTSDSSLAAGLLNPSRGPLRRKIESAGGINPRYLGISTSFGAKPQAKAQPVSEKPALHKGRVNLNPRGFGFVTEDSGGAYFLRANLARFLLTGDEVSFQPEAETGSRDSQEVRALVAIRRKSSLLLCAVQQVGGILALISDEPCFLPLQLAVQDSAAIQPGDVVAVRVPAYEGVPIFKPLQVSVELNLGVRDRPEFDLDYALVRGGLHETMPANLADEIQFEGGEASLEVSPTPFVTIDGESTRDFDDAVYAVARPDGTFLVEVAISDVSGFVRPGTALDGWAAQRCTSVYLPGRTVPMLPEVLSVKECSLVPGQVRRAVVMTLKVSAGGEVLESSVQRQAIRSVARLTYGEVAKFIGGESGVRFTSEVEDNLRVLYSLYRVLAARRGAQGRLDFEEPEPSIVQTAEGVWELQWESRTDAHKLIEELMLLANREAASILVRRYGAGLFRHQPPPDAESWAELSTWAASRDHTMDSIPNLRSMANLVNSRVTPDDQAAAIMKVRSAMRPAKYVVLDSSSAGGHFSLSVDWYTHFTSPIRRYADLLVHRLLLLPAGAEMDGARLAELRRQVEQCSERSQAARMAERLVWDRIKLKAFLVATKQQDVVGARILRITPRGLRVLIAGWQVAAWLPAAALRKLGYKFEDEVWSSGEERPLALLQEGVQLQVRWAHLSLERPAYPELQVEPA